ncbi:hypothetical protein Rhow_003755 [Rhodococcus wratislaviensis]|uniref:Uncharacterized protein n=1 Tax=Rhodococcus wratislaviensis TaxID=44752 RepID=A0A402C913_RHOWR|nr:hypothetical protein Rhow_003755 [Rhodococcus wratislaviensis]
MASVRSRTHGIPFIRCVPASVVIAGGIERVMAITLLVGASVHHAQTR